jgi:hypothetical protein
VSRTRTAGDRFVPTSTRWTRSGSFRAHADGTLPDPGWTHLEPLFPRRSTARRPCFLLPRGRVLPLRGSANRVVGVLLARSSAVRSNTHIGGAANTRGGQNLARCKETCCPCRARAIAGRGVRAMDVRARPQRWRWARRFGAALFHLMSRTGQATRALARSAVPSLMNDEASSSHGDVRLQPVEDDRHPVQSGHRPSLTWRAKMSHQGQAIERF